MEFFAVADLSTTPAALQNTLRVETLDLYCSEIDRILQVDNESRGVIYCLWGEFAVERQVINGGIRFTLPHCPNALSWTITTGHDPAPDQVVIHATINRTTHDADFIESIETFIESWRAGLENHNNRITV